MNLQTFIQEYGEEIESYKEYNNDIIRFTFSEKEKCMLMKGLVCEKLDMKVKTHSHSKPVYWFEPAN